MLIIGIDPGTAIIGFGIIELTGNHFEVVHYGSIQTSKKESLANRLQKLYVDLEKLIIEYKPDHLAVEELFFNKNSKTVLAVGQARGVVLLAGANYGLTIGEYTPLQVKQSVVGYGRAEKRQVQEMVRVVLNLPNIPKPDDVADALAVAICHGHSFKIQKLLREKGEIN
ncbi:crossover junction endodeoxyribonuclease RuvC [Bacillota bacterium LX-D]|nr:crossover junction endodeoxyribonuclease RuvC [Bacillota bacterium LX-D]